MHHATAVAVQMAAMWLFLFLMTEYLILTEFMLRLVYGVCKYHLYKLCVKFIARLRLCVICVATEGLLCYVGEADS